MGTRLDHGLPVVTFLVILIVLGFIGHRVTTVEERALLRKSALRATRQWTDTALKQHRKDNPFRDALHERTPWALTTPVIVGLNVTVFVFMLFGPGSFGDPETLVKWGGSFGPRTTNGEWWRLLTAMFVHSGTLSLLANIVGLVQLGLLLERLVGSVAFAASYLATGIFASVVSLSLYPVAVNVGASGAVFGLYGLLIVWWIWSIVHGSDVNIPLSAIKRLIPAAIVFIATNLWNNDLQIAGQIAGFTVGLACGLVLVVDVASPKAPLGRIVTAMAVGFVIIIASAATLRGITDVRPELERIVAVENSTTRGYQAAADRYKQDHMSAEALARVIETTILPELDDLDARLKALGRVPREHQPFVATAESYVRLRHESWRLRAQGLRRIDTPALRVVTRGAEPESETSLRLRAEALHRANMLMLSRAETTERMSLEILKQLRAFSQYAH